MRITSAATQWAIADGKKEYEQGRANPGVRGVPCTRAAFLPGAALSTRNGILLETPLCKLEKLKLI